MKSFRRILVAVLVLTLSLCYLPLTSVTVSAASTFSGGSGTYDDPFRISSVSDLRSLANDVNNGESYSNTHFKLMSDQTVNNNWTPIGGTSSGGTNAPSYFAGHFNGNGKTINGIITFNLNNQLYSQSGDVSKYLGLFGKIDCGATISNLTVAGGMEYNYTNTSNLGAAAGLLCAYVGSDSTIINCKTTTRLDSSACSVSLISTATADAGSAYVGSLVGIIGGDRSAMIGCYADANITLSAGAGGISAAGGLVGSIVGGQCFIEKCGTDGVVYTPSTAKAAGILGGLVGLSSSASIANCYAGANVTHYYDQSSAVGGFVGAMNDSNISKCYSSGTVTVGSSDKANVGGFAGTFNGASTFTGNFYNSTKNTAAGVYGPTGNNLTNTPYPTGSEAPAGLSILDFGIQANFTSKGWDFANNWQISGGYPVLRPASAINAAADEFNVPYHGYANLPIPTITFSDGTTRASRNLTYYKVNAADIAHNTENYNGYPFYGDKRGETTLQMISKITNSVIGTIKLTVDKEDQAALSIINKPTDNKMTYGSSWIMLTSGGSGSGAVTYQIISGGTAIGSISGNVLTITKAGTITVMATKAGDATYMSKDSEEYTLTIEKADQTNFAINSSSSYKLGSGAYTLSTSGGNGVGAVTYQIIDGSDKATLSGNTLSITQSGTITVKATKAADDNYNQAISANFEIEAETGTQGVLRITSSSSHTFGSNYIITSASDGASGSGAVTYEIQNDGGEGTLAGNVITITKAGNIKIQATKAADVHFNEAKSEWFTLTVNKANQAAISVSGSTSHAFGSTYQIGYTGGTTNGTVTYEQSGGNGQGTISAGGVLTITRAGTFVLQVTMAGNDNYNSVTSETFRLVVSKAEQADDLRITSGTSHTFGTDYTITSAGGSGNGAVTYHILSGSGQGTISNDVLTITKTGNFLIQVRKDEDSNYKPAVGGTITLVVGKAEQTVSITSQNTHTFGTDYTITSTGGPITTSISYFVENGGSGVGEINGDVLSITKAGTINIKAVKAGNDNYNAAETIFELNVGKADRTIAINSASNWSMGVPYTITSTSVGGGAVTYSIENGSSAEGQINGNVLTTTKMGTIILKASQAADDNYNAAESANFELIITISEYGVIIKNVIHVGWNLVATYDTGASASGKIFLAAYDTNGKLFKVSEMKNIQTGLGTIVIFSNFASTLSHDYKVKVFAWSDIDGAVKPLGSSFDITL